MGSGNTFGAVTMQRIVEYEPLVARDLRRAVEWYERQRPGLSDDFRRAVDETVRVVAQRPFSFQVLFRGARRAGTGRFPYGVFYVVTDSAIRIFAVMHHARHPRLWKRRIPKESE
jgi:toxin ParE1/3/4